MNLRKIFDVTGGTRFFNIIEELFQRKKLQKWVFSSVMKVLIMNILWKFILQITERIHT